MDSSYARHPGVQLSDLKKFLKPLRKLATDLLAVVQLPNVPVPNEIQVIVFFDEVNTCEHQGFIKSLVCDNMLDGDPIDKSLNLRFVCALNPYERHTDAMIERLEQAAVAFGHAEETLA